VHLGPARNSLVGEIQHDMNQQTAFLYEEPYLQSGHLGIFKPGIAILHLSHGDIHTNRNALQTILLEPPLTALIGSWWFLKDGTQTVFHTLLEYLKRQTPKMTIS